MAQPETENGPRSPDILVTTANEKLPEIKEEKQIDENCLAPTNRNGNDSYSESDRYFTASSGEESEEDDDEDDDDGGLCIRLDDSDDDGTSGQHINLKTLQAVSNMLAHYNPLIQSDCHGNPTFVAPPPPEEEYNDQSGNNTPRKELSTPNSNRSSKSTIRKSQNGVDEDDYHGALQQLDAVIFSQDKTLLSDAMTELTNVMEKMTS